MVLLVTTRPTTGNTLAWAVACERDQWGRAIAGKLLMKRHFLSLKIMHPILPHKFELRTSNNTVPFAGHVNVAPRHLTAEAETLLSATLVHEVS